jgi:GT2 family glycosyltransferase
LALVAQKMETQSKKVAVLILNWNGKDLLERFLPSVCKFNADFADVIVVDNASTDDSIKFLKEVYPELGRIEFDVNYGFAEGYNKALAQVTHPYAVLLNSDVRVSENWLEAPIAFLDQNKNYAACQPKILDEKAPSKFEYAGASGGYLDRFGYPFCRGRIFDDLEVDQGQYDSVVDVFWASGAALFVRTKCYLEVGGLDASFFAHQEEIDLCWRLLNKDYKIACVPQSKVYHLGGASLAKMNPKKTFLNFRNNLLMLLKNLPVSAFPIIYIRLVLDGVAGFKFLVEGRGSHCWAIVKAHLSFFTRIPSVLFARTQTKRVSSELMLSKSILLAYFIKKIKTFSELNA